MGYDEVNPMVFDMEEKRSAGEEVKGQEGLNHAAYKEEESELGKGKLGGDNGDVAGSDARSSDSLSKSMDEIRSTAIATPEVNSAINAPSQLTIFYAGSVRVFDGIPPEKVKEIMLIAAAAAAANSGDKNNIGTACPTSSPVLRRCPSLQSTAAVVASPQAQLFPCKLQAELPIARRHSLQRFFEKRRDRLVSKNPYSTTSKISDEAKSKADAETEQGTACFEKSGMLSG